MEEWKTYKLEDLCKRVCSGGTPKSTCEEFYGGTIPWLNTKEVNFNRIYETESAITQTGNDNSSAKWVDANSIIVAMYGNTAGKVALAKIPLTTNQACCNLTIDESKADYRYLFYYLLSQYDIIKSKANGAAQQNLNAQQIKDLLIPLPSLETQRIISDILSALDDKIELNNRINHNLEEQAQALYKSWFVDFEPFKDGKFVESELGMIPEGWRYDYIGKLPIYISDYVSNGSFASLKANVKLHNVKEYAHFIRNTDLKSETFPIYVDRHSYEFLSKSQLSGGEIIISNVGDVGSVYICPTLDGPMTLGNNVIMIKPDNELLKYYLYILFKWFEGKQLLKGITGGSAMPKFNKNDFKSLQILIPSTDVLMSFNAAVKPLFNEINTNSSTTQKLSKLRDTILPKLMSGELKINEIDC